MTKTEQIVILHNQGMNAKDISDKLGCKVHMVHCILYRKGLSTHKTNTITEDDCIYINLRCWMNTNKISKLKLCRMMYGNGNNS